MRCQNLNVWRSSQQKETSDVLLPNQPLCSIKQRIDCWNGLLISDFWNHPTFQSSLFINIAEMEFFSLIWSIKYLDDWKCWRDVNELQKIWRRSKLIMQKWWVIWDSLRNWMDDICLMKSWWFREMKKWFGSFLMTYGTGLIIKVRSHQNEFLYLLYKVQILLTWVRSFLKNFLKKRKDSNRKYQPNLTFHLESPHFEFFLYHQ